MAKQRNRSTRFRGFKMIFGLLAAYLLITVGYYSLPWSMRRVVYTHAPAIDHALRSRGYVILQGWDELALTGHDDEVPISQSYRGVKAYGGYPLQRLRRLSRLKMLKNRGYTVGYSDAMKNPLWVEYRIFDVPRLSAGKRPSHFSTDKRTRARISSYAYTDSGFDRGHMAPNYGIATRYGRTAQEQTFLMSNVIPQTPGVNRHIWKNLEMRVAKRYGRYFSEVWVITGPIFQGEIKTLDSGVPIPSAYYKIIVDEHDGKLRALAFLVPHNVPPFTRIKTCLVSIDDIEKETNLDFFPDLPDNVEAALESKPATRLWPWIVPDLEYHWFGKKS